MSIEATIVITTKNRKEDLHKAVVSALSQTGASIEVLVIDDGSTDGTSEMIRSEFPRVQLERSETSKGLIVQRNRGAQLASAPIIFSVDDDAIFSTPNIVAQTLTEFNHPRVGAVAIPFINVKYNSTIHQQAPEGPRVYVTDAYIGTAHALRRDVFLQLDGYKEFFFHQVEESEYCLRLLDKGFVVRLGQADPIHHYESPRRSHKRIFFYSARNNILLAWCNVPFPDLPIRFMGMTCNLMKYGLRKRHPFWTLQGILRGYWDALLHPGWRSPVTRQTYRLNRLLRSKQATALVDIEYRLPPCQRDAKLVDCR